MRVLVVDDEPLARRRLLRLLRNEPDVTVVGECGDGESALQTLARLAPDVLLLDVRMPGIDGLQVAAAARSPRPVIVFVTAYDQYAVAAFEREAVDYLLKPVDGARLRGAIDRARRRLRLRHLPVVSRGRGVFVPVGDIEWIEAARNAVGVHTAGAVHCVRGPLWRVLQRLDPARFRRVSRSAIVNVDRVREVLPWSHGDAVIVLQSGRRVRVSRRYRHELRGSANLGAVPRG
jgi:two-component system LytT family response regulator